MKNERFRNYSLVSYHKADIIKQTLEYLVSVGRVRHWAFIPHDKDKDSENKLKEIHIHILVQLNNAMSLSAVRALFPAGANTLAQPMLDKTDCFNYLTHKDKTDKYQYDECNIVADNMEYWKSLQKGVADDKTIFIIEDLIAGCPFRTMVMRYGRDFVINYAKFASMALMIKDESTQFSPAKPRAFLIDEDTGECSHVKERKQLKMDL